MKRACKLETERPSDDSVNTRSKSSTLYVDLVIGVPLDPMTMDTFSKVGEEF